MSPTVRSGCHKTVEFGVALTILYRPLQERYRAIFSLYEGREQLVVESIQEARILNQQPIEYRVGKKIGGKLRCKVQQRFLRCTRISRYILAGDPVAAM